MGYKQNETQHVNKYEKKTNQNSCQLLTVFKVIMRLKLIN